MTVRLLPDLDNEVTGALSVIEELLLEVCAWEEEAPETVWPAPLADRAALDTVRRIWDAVAPTQGERAAAAGLTGRLLGPDGTYEHMPLRAVDVDPADVAVLAAVARIFGDPHASWFVREALENAATTVYRTGDAEAQTKLVMTCAQLAGLLDLAPDDDTRLLLAAVSGPADEDVVLSPAAEAAYKRYARRANAMWTLSDALAAYLY